MNDNFSFYLNNFQNLEKSFRNKLKEKFEDGKVNEMILRVHSINIYFNLFIVRRDNFLKQ